MCVCVGTCTCVSVCMWGPSVDMGVFLDHSPLYMLKEGLWLNPELVNSCSSSSLACPRIPAPAS